MSTFLRAFLLLSLLLAPARAANNNAVPPAVPTPSSLDVVSFDFDKDGEVHKIVVTMAPTLTRIDEATEGYSVIYTPDSQFYTGLEHRNYTYWDFSWPAVRDAVEGSKRHEDRLQQLGNEGLNPESTDGTTPSLTPNPASGTTASAGAPDDSGYVWHPTTDKKRIADLECVRWTGDTVSGENVEAWCYAGTLPRVQYAIANLHAMAEPMALVPVRDLAPDFIFPVFAALQKGGLTPILITWGTGQEKHHFRFLEASRRDGTLALFTVPKLYVKTTLITMDGMTDAQPPPEPKKDKPVKTWQTQ
jgi:hypothetical protein